MPAHKDDIELLEALKANNQKAWSRFYNASKVTIEAVLFKYKFGYDEHLFKDVTQQIMIRLVEKVVGSYNPEGARLQTWVYTVARNMMVDMARREQKRNTVPFSHLLMIDKHGKSTDLDALRKSHEPSVEEKQVTWQQLMVYSFLNSLDREHFHIVNQYYFLDVPLLDVGTEMGISYNMIKSINYRMRDRMLAFMINGKLKDLECYKYHQTLDSVVQLKFKHEGEWLAMLERCDPPAGIPRFPQFYYYKKGWTSWENFLRGR